MDTGIHQTYKESFFVSPKILADAVSGRYVDLQEFIPLEFFRPWDNSITMRHNTDTDTISFHQAPPAQRIETLTDWLRAWSTYERILVNNKCSLYNALASYRELILSCSRKFQWSSVFLYDRHFRATLGAQQSFSFDVMHHDLYVTILDSSAVRKDVPRCHRCMSFDHKVAFCPFPRSHPRHRRKRQHSVQSSDTVQLPQSVPLMHMGPGSSCATTMNENSSFSQPSVLQQPHLATDLQQGSSHKPPLHTTQTAISPLSPLSSLSLDTSSSPPGESKPPLPFSRPSTYSSSGAQPSIATSVSSSIPSNGFQLQSAQSVATSAIRQTPTVICTPSVPTPQARPSSPIYSLAPPPTILSPTQVVTTPIQRLNADAFQQGLLHHPDRDFATYIVRACLEGVDIGYKGPRFYREFSNWPSTITFDEHVKSSIDKEVAAGIKIGPFSQPPFRNFVGSPMGAFQRKRSLKVCTIHDLSWKPGIAVNAFINKEDFHIKYLTLDQVISSILERGRHRQLAKLDLEAAFHHIPVRPQDFELLGSTFYRFNPITNTYCKEYYYDRVLQFGARSSPKLFSDFAAAAKYIMCSNGATYAEQYLDDYITMGAAGTTECADNLHTMMNTCHDLGFTLNPSKICQPSTVMEYLGIILDTDLLQARISADRLEEVMSELNQWRHRQTATKRQILSLIGKLTFVSRVVRPGRTFTRRMISLASKIPHLHHQVHLTKDFKLDVQWWLHYLPQWNGVSFFPQSHWESSIDLHLYTDSSDLAAAGYLAGAWFVVPFVHEFAELKHLSINWRELFAIVVAADTFGSQWTGKRIMFHCDNMCIVEVIKNGTCRSDIIMDHVRKLFFICAKFEFEINMCYVNTKVNDIADALSRLQFHRFRQLAPHADQGMTMPVIMSPTNSSSHDV